jgi:DNA-binding MarR family transcriptional regulator
MMMALIRMKKVGSTLPAKIGLGMPETMTLMYLHSRNDKHCDPKEEGCGSVPDFLHKELDVTKPAISQILKGLEAKGLVKRKHNPDDARKVDVKITKDGKHKLREIREYGDRVFDKTLHKMGKENVRNLIKLLNEFNTTLQHNVEKENKNE